jgi:hypothetical protein
MRGWTQDGKGRMGWITPESVAWRWEEPASKLLFMKPSGSWLSGFASRCLHTKPVAFGGHKAHDRLAEERLEMGSCTLLLGSTPNLLRSLGTRPSFAV